MKKCAKCNKEFEYSEFNFQNKKKGTLRPYCCYCDRARSRKNYQDNREDRLATQREWQLRNNYKAPGGYKHNAVPGVYMMINLITGEKYIGSSKNVYRRRSSWRVRNSHLNLDMNDFVWGVVEETDNYREREQYYISVYQPELNNYGKQEK